MRVRLAITPGDPAGIGPEIVLRTLRAWKRPRGVELLPVGTPEVYERHGRLPRDARLRPIAARFPGSEALGISTAAAGAYAYAAVAEGIRLVLAGEADALVTGPLHKGSLELAGAPHTGHTEMLRGATGAPRVLMAFAKGRLRVAIQTIHVPLLDVPRLVTREAVLGSLRIADRALREWFGIPRPRIAVCGVNPHGGEGGLFGAEDVREVVPAIEAARAEGIEAGGPWAGDGVFHPGPLRRTDLVLAMYHDQGLGPFKALARGAGAQVSLGLPIVRTSVAHGTAFDIAGKGIASTRSLEDAIALAAGIVRRLRAGSQRPAGAGFAGTAAGAGLRSDPSSGGR